MDNKSNYNSEWQKEYRKKVGQFNVKYTLSETDLQTVEALRKAIATSGKSNNIWIQEAIKEKLVKDGFLTEK